GAGEQAGNEPCCFRVFLQGVDEWVNEPSCWVMASRSSTSPYLLSMSIRLLWCCCSERSATQSRITKGGNPYCMASTALARMQPLVVMPAMIRLLTPALVRMLARGVPKNADACGL